MTVTCEDLLDRVIERKRLADTWASMNDEAAFLADECSYEYRVFVDYTSIKMFHGFDADSECSEYRDFDVERVAIDLARRDGFCADTGAVLAAGDSDWSPAYWTCSYAPTYNDDWHDDVLCSNGTEQQRPYLRAWDDFVTEDEILASAEEYAQQLNGG